MPSILGVRRNHVTSEKPARTLRCAVVVLTATNSLWTDRPIYIYQAQGCHQRLDRDQSFKGRLQLQKRPSNNKKPEMNNSTESPEVRLEAARRERDRLLAERELRELTEQISILQRGSHFQPQLDEHSSMQDPSVCGSYMSHKRSSSASSEYSHAKRSMRPKDPE